MDQNLKRDMSTRDWHLITSVKDSLDCWSLWQAMFPFTIASCGHIVFLYQSLSPVSELFRLSSTTDCVKMLQGSAIFGMKKSVWSKQLNNSLSLAITAVQITMCLSSSKDLVVYNPNPSSNHYSKRLEKPHPQLLWHKTISPIHKSIYFCRFCFIKKKTKKHAEIQA